MFKRTLTMAGVASLIATAAIAGDMTPKQVMEKHMNCPACKPMAEYPQLYPHIRVNVFETKAGFVSTFMMDDGSVVPTYREFEKKAEPVLAEVSKMPDAEAKETLCPICYGMKGVMARKDVAVEMFPAETGTVTVAIATTPEGTKALHEYAKMARETMMLMSQAMTESSNTEKMGEMK